MVSPGTHLIKNHETMSITNELLLKTTRGHKLKVLEPSCNQTLNLETDDKTLYCRLLKLKYRLKQIQSTVHTLTCLTYVHSGHFLLSPRLRWPTWRVSTVCMLLQTKATKITRTGYSTKKSSNRWIVLCIPRDTFHELFWWDPKNHKSIDFLVEYPICVISCGCCLI